MTLSEIADLYSIKLRIPGFLAELEIITKLEIANYTSCAIRMLRLIRFHYPLVLAPRRQLWYLSVRDVPCDPEGKDRGPVASSKIPTRTRY